MEFACMSACMSAAALLTHTLSHFRKTVAMAAASQLLELALTIKPDGYL